MEIILRDYQKILCDKVDEAIISGGGAPSRVLCVAPTGAGKSVMIAYLANKLPGRTLILTHRKEILEQNSGWISGAGVLEASKRSQKVIAKIRRAKIVVSMTQTLDARIKKHGDMYIGDFDNIISDEVHIDIFQKVISRYDNNVLVGFTATPISGKRETMEVFDEALQENVTYGRQLTMSRDFDILVDEVSEQDLIDRGFLTQDFNVVLKVPGMDTLVKSESQPDGFTSKSLTNVYSGRAAMDVLISAYLRHGKGKKVLIFNPTAKVNLAVYKAFSEAKINCFLFDSVNPSDKTRKEVIEWFRTQEDAVLINCNVFTTGFDVSDVQTVILNRATKSLSLYLQMVGRGSRITDIVYKPNFTVVDLGGNLAEHGRWSKRRDWSEYFHPKRWKRKESIDELKLWICKECGYFNEPGQVCDEHGVIRCANCDTPRKIKKEKSPRTGELVYVDKPMAPRAEPIINYTKRIGGNATTAFKILESEIVDLFYHHEVTHDFYRSREREFRKRIIDIYRPIYFAIINDSELDGKKRKYSTQINKVVERVNNIYNTEAHG